MFSAHTVENGKAAITRAPRIDRILIVNLHPRNVVSGLTRDSLVSGLFCSESTMIACASMHRREIDHDVTVLHPWMEVKGMTIMRLQRLHLSSNPCPCTFAIS